MKVYLQYPCGFSDSPYYKYLIDYSPSGVEYQNGKANGVITNKKNFLLSKFIKNNIRKVANTLRVSIPNVHLSPEGDYDLIHSAHCLSNNEENWVADIEREWSLYIGNKNKRAVKKVREILNRNNCKKILSWTQATADELVKEYPEIKDKIEVVYPAVPIQEPKEHIGIYLLFVARYFEAKGGRLALDVMDKLTKKYGNVYATVVSDTPKEVIDHYSKNLKIRFLGLMKQEELFKTVYPYSDILIYPGYSDSFGFAYLEAMSFGIPIITVDGFARKEIIEEGKTGFVIDCIDVVWKRGRPRIRNEETLSEEMVIKASKLIEDKELRREMSMRCRTEIGIGKFSIWNRNNQLKRIYEEAI